MLDSESTLTDQGIADCIFEKLQEMLPDNKELEELEPYPMFEWEFVNKGLVTEQSLLEMYAELSGLESLEDEDLDIVEKFEETNFDYLNEKALIPYSWEDEDQIVLAISSPYSLGDISLQWFSSYEKEVGFFLARRSVIERKITEVYQNLDAFGLDGGSEDALRDLAKEAPIVRLVNDVFARAVEMGASDIHVEPSENDLVIRYRVDGVLITAFSTLR